MSRFGCDPVPVGEPGPDRQDWPELDEIERGQERERGAE